MSTNPRKRSMSAGNLHNVKSGSSSSATTSRRSSLLKPHKIHGSRKSLSARATELIVQIPVEHLRKIRETEGKSWDREAQHFCGITTMHGPLRAYRGKRPYRHLWGVMMLCSFTLLCIQVRALLTDYFSKPLSSKVTFVNSDHGLRFPFVTICNYNPITKKYLSAMNSSSNSLFTDKVFKYLVQTNAELPGFRSSAKESDLEDGHKEFETFAQSYYAKTGHNYSVHDFFKEGGYGCSDLFKICSFSGVKFDCCDRIHSTMTALGKCFTLNITETEFHKQTSPGEYNGLQLVLDANLDEIYDGPGDESDPVFTNSFEYGFRLYVHDRQLASFRTSEGISVSPGNRVYASLEAEKFSRLSKDDWGKCSDEWPASMENLLSKSNIKLKYSKRNCRAICRANFFNDKCGCSPYAFNALGFFKTCSPKEMFSCLRAINSSEILDTQICSDCNDECQSWEYHAYNSYGSGFSKGALKWLHERNSNWSEETMKYNFVMVSMFYRDLAYTLYEEQPATTLTDVLSNIGGNMGLCFGMSVITVAEIIIFLTKMSWISFSKQRRNYMIDKKKKEEEQERHLEETVKEYARQKAMREDIVTVSRSPFKKLSTRIKGTFDIMDRTGKVGDAEEINRKHSKQVYLKNFYDELLTGGGRANLHSNDDLFELKIAMKENDGDNEVLNVVGEVRNTADPDVRSPPINVGFKTKKVFSFDEEEEEGPVKNFGTDAPNSEETELGSHPLNSLTF